MNFSAYITAPVPKPSLKLRGRLTEL